MKEVVLVPRAQPQVGLEAECISPDVFAGKGSGEIVELAVYEGKVERRLGDFFEVSGDAGAAPGSTRIVIEGSVERTKRIGQGMTGGEVVVKGGAGMHLGSRMRGGRIVVEGDVDAFACQEMRGGEVLIKGCSGDYLGSAYRGNWRGMRGGVITVEGDAGSEIGSFMRGGLILVKGDAGPFAGVHMRGGLIVVEGRVARRVGAEMTGGAIVAGRVEAVLPGFTFEGAVVDPSVEGRAFKGRYRRYTGDHAESRAKGVLLVRE